MTSPAGVLRPVGPTGHSVAAVQELEHGNWAAARRLSDRVGGTGLPVSKLAEYMKCRAHGLLPEAWTCLAESARLCLPAGARHGVLPEDPAHPAPIAWPTGPGEFWRCLARVGRREEMQMRELWHRIEDAQHPKRVAMIEACIEHETWVEHDHNTWTRPGDDDWLFANDRVTRGCYGEFGRQYVIRRSCEVWLWVFPLTGGVSKRVWEDLGTARGLRAEARRELRRRSEQRPVGGSASQRFAYQEAVRVARGY